MATQKAVAEKAKGQKVVTVYDFLEQKKDLIAKALPASITPDRLIGVFTMVLRSSPELAKCSQMSLISAVIQTVQLGLTPGNIGHCYFIPFKNKDKGLEVQFVIGYKGIVELVNRCGKASLISTEIVRDGDHFECEMGLNPVLKHIPAWDGEQMPIKGVYCVAKNLVANEKVFVYMSKAEIDKVRAASKAGQSDYSPWAKWYEEMAKKTVVKRICKLLPLSVEDQRKVAQDETIKNEIAPDMASVKDDTNWDGDTIEAPPMDPGPSPEPGYEDVSRETTEPVGEEEPAPGQELPEEPERPPAPTGPVITEKQGKRFYAIAKGSGYSDEEIKQHLSWEYGIDSSREITKDIYEEVCAHFEKPKQ
jgi:recombination protein RecT